MPHLYTIALSSLAALTMASGTLWRSYHEGSAIVPISVPTQTIRRVDPFGFSYRWDPVNTLPPTTTIVRTTTERAAARIDEPQTVGTTVSVRRPPTPQYRQPRETNICTRHHRRKVYVSRHRWICLR